MVKSVGLRFCLWVVVGVAFMVASSAQAAEILKARAGLHADKTRFVLDFSAKPIYGFDKNPEDGQIVIELKNAGVPKGRVVPSTTIGLVEHTMFISKGGKSSNVVLFLTKPSKVANSFLIPGGKGKVHRLVIDLISIEKQ